MKHKFLAAVATFAFVATGVAAQAQDNPKEKERPAAAEKMEHKSPEAPKAAMEKKAPDAPKAAQMERKEAPKGAETERKEGPKAAETNRKEDPKAADTERKEGPKAAETNRKEGPKAAETNRKEGPKAAETNRKEGPKAAETERKEAPKAAETERKEGPKAAQSEERKDSMKPGAQKPDRRTAEHDGKARAMGKVKMSNEHAARVGESLRRDARPVRAGIDIRVGVRVPSEVEIRPLPEDVIVLAPEYRGYDYFIDSDDQIVFVSPETHEIVGTIEYEGRAASEDVTHVRAARPCPTED